MIPCCCQQGCSSYEDVFNTDTSSTEFTTVAGTFSHSGDELSTTSASAILIADHQLPADRGTVTTVAKSTVSGNNIDLFCNYVDSSNYIFARFNINAGFPAGSITIFKRTAGVNSSQGTVSVNLSADTYYLFSVCWDGTYVVAAVNSLTSGRLGSLTTTTSAHTGGNQGGIGGTRSSGTLYFDEFNIYGAVADNAECPACSECDTGTYTDTFTSLDSKWELGGAGFTGGTAFSVAAGVLVHEKTTGGSGGAAIFRCYDRPSSMTGLVITQEVTLTDFTDLGATAAEYFGVGFLLVSGYTVQIEGRINNTLGDGYVAEPANIDIGGAPAPGDVLKIVATENGGVYDIDYYINGVLEYTDTGRSLTITDPFDHGVYMTTTAGNVTWEWDDYSFKIE